MALTPGAPLSAAWCAVFEALAFIALIGMPIGAWSFWRERRTAASVAVGAALGMLGTPAFAAALGFAAAVAHVRLP